MDKNSSEAIYRVPSRSKRIYRDNNRSLSGECRISVFSGAYLVSQARQMPLLNMKLRSNRTVLLLRMQETKLKIQRKQNAQSKIVLSWR